MSAPVRRRPADGSPYQSAVPPLTVRAVRRQQCPQCETCAGLPCTGHGDHLARWIASVLADGGRILAEDVVAAVAGMDLIVGPGAA